jgi:hypothetical protein
MNRSPSLHQIIFAINATLLPFPKVEACQSIHLSSSLTGNVRLLCVVQQRGSLLVCWDNILLTSEGELLAENAWDSNAKCGNEEDAHNDKSEDPLEGDGLGEKLADTERSSQNAECEAYGVVLCHVNNWRLYKSRTTNLVYNEEEQTIDKNTPDCNVGQDTSCQCRVVVIEHNSTIPV